MRYIDADALIKKIYPMGVGDGKYILNAKAVKLAIDNAPTADVVPKSEVEKLSIELLHAKEDYGDLCAEFIGAGKKIEKLEKELADMLVSEYTDVSVSMERLYRIRTEHPIYTAIKAEVAREIFEEIETALKLYKQYDLESGTYFECYLEADIAERKKKYTGGTE